LPPLPIRFFGGILLGGNRISLGACKHRAADAFTSGELFLLLLFFFSMTLRDFALVVLVS
jgi:hypothetical protein